MRRRRLARSGPLLLNILTLAVLALTVAGAAALTLVFFQPRHPFNPYPPATLPVLAVLPTHSNLPTAEIAIATVTPLFSATPSPSVTPSPTGTPLPSAMASPTRTEPPPSLTPTTEPSPTRIGSGSFEFVVQDSSPLALANFANDSGCNWLGVAGTVFDSAGNGLDGFTIQLEGGGLSLSAISGSAPAYSPAGGYEFALADHVIATQAEYSVQLYNSAGQPVSIRLFFDTFADCERNLILINFERAA